MTTTTNGRGARPTLATQIDRLDRLLDGLSENLTEAVADAVRAAVLTAVQTVLTEVFTSPEILARLRDALPPAPTTPPVATPVARPGLGQRVFQAWSWLGGKLRSVVNACRGGLNRFGAAVVHQCERARSAVQATWLRLRVLRHFQGQLLLALGVGVAAGVTTYLAAPWLAALLSGLGGFMTAVTVQGAVLLLRLVAASCPGRTWRSFRGEAQA
jgi:hypothetical protein